MKTEYETKVLEIDVNLFKEKLNKLGAKYVGRFEQKRYTYNIVPQTKDKWIRLRTDGVKTTLCFKSILNDGIGGTNEIEFEVPNFEQTHEFLLSIGIPHKQYQENVRTQYILDGIEIDIDEWPMLPPYAEIEGKNETEVLETIQKLDFDKTKCTSINTQGVYSMYGIDLESISDLRF